MPRPIRAYVRFVEAVNYRVGRIAMYLLYVMMGVLIWSTVSKVTPWPSIWTLEMAQFVMVAYYMLGGPYSLQLDSNVRMDLLYHRWSPRTRAWVDAFSVFALLFYLGRAAMGRGRIRPPIRSNMPSAARPPGGPISRRSRS